MDEDTIETKTLLNKARAEQIMTDFQNKPNVIKGDCFDEILDKIDED